MNDPMTLWMDTPIPEQRKWDWRAVKDISLAPVDEPLVPLSLVPERIISRPEYFIQGLPGALPDCFLRKRVFSLLVSAWEFLPSGYRFVVFDGWRSRTLQSSLFQVLKEEIQREEPELCCEELEKRTCQYVALPSRDRYAPSPHSTGGSVDLSIVDARGSSLDMGTSFDTTLPSSETRYFEKKLVLQGVLDERENLILKNRRMLYHILIQAGFTNYPDEWWHFDYGNQNWAYIKGGAEQAIYGEITPEMRWKKDF